MNLKRIHTPVETNQWTGPVRIYTLGRFTLVINGFPVDVAGRVQKKPLLLLKAIVSLGGRDIREDQLSDILWPEADGDSGHNAFTTTLSRLRKLIQNDSAIQIANGRLSLNNRICWVDRWEFEKLCNQLELLIEEGLDDPMRSMSAKDLAAGTVKLYGGPFLQSDGDQAWTIATRERLRTKYLKLVGWISWFLTSSGRDEEAIDYFRKGLEAEPLSETFYQGLMSAFIRLERPAEALAVFNQCRNVLSAHSISLSERTNGIMKLIRRDSTD